PIVPERRAGDVPAPATTNSLFFGTRLPTFGYQHLALPTTRYFRSLAGCAARASFSERHDRASTAVVPRASNISAITICFIVPSQIRRAVLRRPADRRRARLPRYRTGLDRCRDGPF